MSPQPLRETRNGKWEMGKENRETLSRVYLQRRTNSSFSILLRHLVQGQLSSSWRGAFNRESSSVFPFQAANIFICFADLCVLCAACFVPLCGSKFLMNLHVVFGVSVMKRGKGEREREGGKCGEGSRESATLALFIYHAPSSLCSTSLFSALPCSHFIFKTHSANIDTAANCLKCAIPQTNC